MKLNLALIDEVFVETKIDLAPKDSDLSAVVGILFDDRALGALLWSLSQSQAEKKGVDRQQFNEGLDAEALKAGWGAVVDAILFTRTKSPKLADAQREGFEAQMKLIDATAGQMIESIKKQTSGAAMKTLISTFRTRMENGLDQTRDKSVSS